MAFINPPIRLGYDTKAFKGLIEETKIYNRALSAAEIQADYNSWMHSSYLSPVKDAGSAVNWDAMDWNAFVDVNNNVTVDYRGCSTADCSTAGDWQTNLRGNPPGTWESNIYADNNRYFQYRVNFDTNKQQWNAFRNPLDGTDKGAFGHFSNIVVTYSSAITNIVPDANIWKVDNYDLNAALPSFSYAADGNLAIKFRATDQDNDDLNFNMWYGATASAKTTVIVRDINLSTDTAHGACDTNNKAAGMVCSWDWNISGIADNNYWVTIEINDGTDSNTATTQKSFRVNPEEAPPATCDCPTSGHWNIADGSVCTLSTVCSLSAGSLHIFNGSLYITATGTLSIPTGYKIIIAKTNGKLVVEKQGKVIINK
jgi:hypothetical protein